LQAYAEKISFDTLNKASRVTNPSPDVLQAKIKDHDQQDEGDDKDHGDRVIGLHICSC
jgi:hypothetical protein